VKAAVREAFIPFTAPMEGVVPYFYQDILGLVTIGIGNLVDPIEHALTLPLVRPDGVPATRNEIAAEWRRIKAHPDLKTWGHRPAERMTSLRLTDEGIRSVVFAKMDQMVCELVKRFPGWHAWPADAQLATISMSWACGPWFRFTTLAEALKAEDWVKASQSCHINEKGNPGIVPRNHANKLLYLNAARVVETGRDPEVLLWGNEDAPIDAT